MTLDILIEALEAFRDRGDHADYKAQEIRRSLTELYRLRIVTKEQQDIWLGAVQVISQRDAIAIQNKLLYDVYGKLVRELGRAPTLSEFYKDAKLIYGFEEAIPDSLEAGFDFIGDLWSANEDSGDNAASGAFGARTSLKPLKHFKHWHDHTAGNEEFYDELYELNFAGRSVRLSFNADIWDAVDNLLRIAIEDYD